ncbi:MAG TPA: chromate efflux transporter [Actinomycetota bacterium]
MTEPARPAPSFRQALRFWTLLGFVNFGGPTGQIAIMHDELVERRRWIDEERFLHALSFCTLLPGPEAQQLAIYVGWLLHGLRGGLVAGTLFVLPAAVLILALAWTYAAHGSLDLVTSVFAGLSAAVVGIVAAATLTIAPRAIRAPLGVAIAIGAFLTIWLAVVPFPLVVLAAGLAGLAAGPDRLGVPEDATPVQAGPRPATGRTVATVAIGLAVWWLPLLAVAAATGVTSIYSREGVFFSQAAMVTFGGAYAVLAFVGREVVARFGLTTGDVVAGLGLAETTPGPLILVVEFLGFLAAYREPGDLSPVVAGAIGAAVTLWATFVPSFVWIFAGAPYMERLRANHRLRGLLAGITASVVGVIAGLAVSIGTVVLFDRTVIVRPFGGDVTLPVLGTIDPLAATLAVGAFVAMRRFKVHVVWIVVAAASVGLAAGLLR